LHNETQYGDKVELEGFKSSEGAPNRAGSSSTSRAHGLKCALRGRCRCPSAGMDEFEVEVQTEKSACRPSHGDAVPHAYTSLPFRQQKWWMHEKWWNARSFRRLLCSGKRLPNDAFQPRPANASERRPLRPPLLFQPHQLRHVAYSCCELEILVSLSTTLRESCQRYSRHNASLVPPRHTVDVRCLTNTERRLEEESDCINSLSDCLSLMLINFRR
jgi:hypothetical protein